MAKGEQGYLTLLGAGRVPQVPSYTAETWKDALDAVRDLSSFGTIVLDAMGGFEALCHEHICRTQFSNDWLKFNNYHKGQETSIQQWKGLLDMLEKSGCTVIILSHSIVKTFSDPLGADYDRYVVDCHKYTWGITHKWADAVLFGTMESLVQTEKGKRGKGIGGEDRVIFTEHRDAYDAKNRYGMPERIDIPNTPETTFNEIFQHIKKED